MKKKIKDLTNRKRSFRCLLGFHKEGCLCYHDRDEYYTTTCLRCGRKLYKHRLDWKWREVEIDE